MIKTYEEYQVFAKQGVQDELLQKSWKDKNGRWWDLSTQKKVTVTTPIGEGVVSGHQGDFISVSFPDGKSQIFKTGEIEINGIFENTYTCNINDKKLQMLTNMQIFSDEKSITQFLKESGYNGDIKILKLKSGEIVESKVIKS